MLENGTIMPANWTKPKAGRGPQMRVVTMLRACFITFAFALCAAPALFANTLKAGPNQQFATPCAAIAAAADGDTVEVDSSVVYRGDVCRWSRNGLTVIGVGPRRAVLDAAGKSSEGKAIWIIAGNDNTVENIEFIHAKVRDLNGAGIRLEGTNLTVRNCYFHDNQEGILSGVNAASTVTIEYSEFANNGAGDGQSHNLYIGNVKKLIFQFNYSHDAIVGHLLKSRAAENYIAYNMLADGAGDASYELDLPNGGKSNVIGNLIEQGPQTGNDNILAYMEEGDSPLCPSHELYVVNNTFVNDYSKGIFVYVGVSDDTPVLIQNNIFAGQGTITNQPRPQRANNATGYVDFVNRGDFDYHLKPRAPQAHAGSKPRLREGIDAALLTPQFQYVADACGETRPAATGAIDLGAYSVIRRSDTPAPDAPARCNTLTTK